MNPARARRAPPGSLRGPLSACSGMCEHEVQKKKRDHANARPGMNPRKRRLQLVGKQSPYNPGEM